MPESWKDCLNMLPCFTELQSRTDSADEPLPQVTDASRSCATTLQSAPSAMRGASEINLGGCPRIAIVARARLVELDFSII
jgi:hypothetical protein